MEGKTNNYPRSISHPWVNLWERWGGGTAHSHFGLKDLGHALTDWLTSEQWDRNPGVESELESISWMTDTWEIDTERLRGESLASQPVALTYIFKLCMRVCVCVFAFVWGRDVSGLSMHRFVQASICMRGGVWMHTCVQLCVHVCGCVRLFHWECVSPCVRSCINAYLRLCGCLCAFRCSGDDSV